MKNIKTAIRAVLSLGILSCLIFGAAGCQGNGLETKAPDMVELSTWIFTSGVPNNLITVKSEDENLTFECRADEGYLLYQSQYHKEITLSSGETVHWAFSDTEWIHKDVPVDYVDIVVKEEDRIVGYAVIRITQRDGMDFSAKVVKSVMFKKIDGKYQSVTDSELNERLQTTRKS